MVVKYSKSAMKTINKLDKPTKDRVRAGIEGLKQSPPQGDIKDMKGIENAGLKRLRVGQYRVIYRYDEGEGMQILYIIKIGPRGDVYK